MILTLDASDFDLTKNRNTFIRQALIELEIRLH